MDRRQTAATAETTEKLSKWWLVPLLILLAVPAVLFWPKAPERGLVLLTTTTENAQADVVSGTTDTGDYHVFVVDERDHFPVYLTGAVYLPGLYYVPDGSILADVVAEAGGLRDNAAAEQINLAMRVLAHQMFYIPTVAEVLEDPSKVDLLQRYPGVADGKININTADEATLITLPGVGPATAQAIIRYRESNGPFQTTADIMNIPGIKKAKYEGLEMYITVGG